MRSLAMRRGLAAGLSALSALLWPADARAQVAGIAVEPSGHIVAVDFFRDAVLRVDPTTGAIQTVSSATVGSGPLLTAAWGIAVAGDGGLLLSAGTAILRVDPLTGDRTTVSDAATGGGPAFLGLRAIATAPDGGIFVTEDLGGAPSLDRVLRVDAATGDRLLVSDLTVGGGPAMASPLGLGVEADGSLVCADGGLRAVLRIDHSTGDRTVVSDAATGEGRSFGDLQSVAVEEDTTLVALDQHRELFCAQLCPHPLCYYCIAAAPAVYRVDSEDGDRAVVSGGGTCLVAVGAGCVTRPLGRRGRGPDLEFPRALAVEPAGSFVVADEDRIVRVDPSRGRRTLLATIGLTPADAVASSAAPPVLRDLAAIEPERVYRPPDPQGWLDGAVGRAERKRARRPEALFQDLTAERRRVLGERLYAALWQTMREVLGADHPDTVTAAPRNDTGE